jgi:predicted negative regulator of RcsB-dependent stress response
VSSKNKLSKKDIKGPDMFVSTSDKIFGWMEDHIGAIIAVLLVVAVVALGGVGYRYWVDAQESKAAEALFKPETELRETEGKLREAQAAKMQALAAGKEKKIEETEPGDYAKDYQPTVEKIVAAIKDHAGTKAALVSALNLASFLIQQKQFPAALQVLETAKYQPSGGDLLSGFWHMHRGLAFLENQKADEAIKEYKSVLDSGSLKSFHPEAWLKMGVALEMKGDAAKARETYEKVAREFKGTEASNTANQYLRLLELKPQEG